MECIDVDFNKILNRTSLAKNIENFLDNFFHKHDSTNSNTNIINTSHAINNNTKKGIYLYGDNGIGKTKFVVNLLKKLNYDILYYDNSILRNKCLIENISETNLTNNNVYSMFFEKPKKIVIVVDDLESMNCGDKNGMIALIKLIREKKTKKQKLENLSNSPIICINNRSNDKKIIELMKVCHVIELNTPRDYQTINLINKMMPNIFNYSEHENSCIQTNILKFLNTNLIKIEKLYLYYKNNFIFDRFYNYNDKINSEEKNIKLITNNLLRTHNKFSDSHKILDSDRTIVSLMFHENIINILAPKDYEIYLELLDNLSFGDYIDRVIFQKQIWQLTEINYLIKIFYNNHLINKYELFNPNNNVENIIFTKVLTKYSSEYNNLLFLYNLQQSFLTDKKDFMNYFMSNDINNINYEILEFYNISKLEIQRIYRFINYLKNDEQIDNAFKNDDLQDTILNNNEYEHSEHIEQDNILKNDVL